MQLFLAALVNNRKSVQDVQEYQMVKLCERTLHFLVCDKSELGRVPALFKS